MVHYMGGRREPWALATGRSVTASAPTTITTAAVAYTGDVTIVPDGCPYDKTWVRHCNAAMEAAPSWAATVQQRYSPGARPVA